MRAALGLLLLGAALPLQARRVVIAVDGSGSMKESAAAYALPDALGRFVEALDARDELALVRFDDHASLLRAPAPLGTGGATIARTQFQTLEYDGSYSDLPAALALACDAYPADDAQPTDVFLVTDGIVTLRPPRSAAEAITDMQQRLLPRCIASGARIHVIGIGGDRANTAVLQALAEASGGRSEFPLSSARLGEFLAAYVRESAPPPPPPAATAPVQAAAKPAAPAPPPRRSPWPFLAAGATALTALAVVLLALARRRKRQADMMGATGLVTVREMPSGREHSLKLPATFGRSPSSALPIEDKEASRRHFRLEAHDTKVAVVDLGSANGTFLNGVRLKENDPRIVRPGDKLRVPGLELILQPPAMDADATYIRQDLDGTMIRPAEGEGRPRRTG